jgi:hypothetical protein
MPDKRKAGSFRPPPAPQAHTAHREPQPRTATANRNREPQPRTATAAAARTANRNREPQPQPQPQPRTATANRSRSRNRNRSRESQPQPRIAAAISDALRALRSAGALALARRLRTHLASSRVGDAPLEIRGQCARCHGACALLAGGRESAPSASGRPKVLPQRAERGGCSQPRTKGSGPCSSPTKSRSS